MLAALILAATAAADSTRIHDMLLTFLDGAGRGDAAVHDRFWAEDLVYTGSAGRRTDKPTLMRDVRSAPPSAPTDPRTRYGAEDVIIRVYDSSALVAFRLVSTTQRPDSLEVQRFLNTGMFVKREGQWRVVGWQATRQP